MTDLCVAVDSVAVAAVVAAAARFPVTAQLVVVLHVLALRVLALLALPPPVLTLLADAAGAQDVGSAAAAAQFAALAAVALFSAVAAMSRADLAAAAPNGLWRWDAHRPLCFLLHSSPPRAMLSTSRMSHHPDRTLLNGERAQRQNELRDHARVPQVDRAEQTRARDHGSIAFVSGLPLTEESSSESLPSLFSPTDTCNAFLHHTPEYGVSLVLLSIR